MLRMSRYGRGFALAWAVLQLALPAVGTLTEAQLASDSSPAESLGHFEERSGPGCQPVHGPDCARCQALSTYAAGAPAPAVGWVGVAVVGSPVGEGRGRAAGARPALPLSRAPPHAS